MQIRWMACKNMIVLYLQNINANSCNAFSDTEWPYTGHNTVPAICGCVVQMKSITVCVLCNVCFSIEWFFLKCFTKSVIAKVYGIICCGCVSNGGFSGLNECCSHIFNRSIGLFYGMMRELYCEFTKLCIAFESWAWY